MGYIDLPDSMFTDTNPAPAAPPPVDPMVAREQQIADTTRAEEALNGFLGAQQHAMFEAPDAFYRTQGSDAIHAAPLISDRLSQLRDDFLDGLANDAQRDRLGRSLDAHMQLARDDIARHVAEQSLAWQRKTAQDRIALLTKEAAYHHNDDGRLDALGAAAANAARAYARVGDNPSVPGAEDAAAAGARSGIYNAAILARLGGDDPAAAAQILARVKDQLDPAHAEPLQAQIETAQRLAAAKAYATQVVPPETPSSPEEVEAQRDAVLQRAAEDHAGDPLGQLLAEHSINGGFDAHRNTLYQADTDRAAAIQHWLYTPDADGRPQTALPPAELLSLLPPRDQVELLKELRGNGRPAASGMPSPESPQGDVESESAGLPSEYEPAIVPVDATSEEAIQTAQAGQQGKPSATPANPEPGAPPPAPPNDPKALAEQARQRRSVANHQELNRLVSASRAPGDINGPLPVDWEKRLPKRTLEALDASATRYGVPRRLLAAVLWQESTFNERASEGTPRSGQGLAGLTHDGIGDLINRAVVRKDITRERELRSFDRMNGPQAVNMAAEYLRVMYDENHQSWPAAVLGYKGGRTAAYGWLNGTGEKIKDTKNGGALWATIPPYLRNVFERDPGMYDRKTSPDIP